MTRRSAPEGASRITTAKQDHEQRTAPAPTLPAGGPNRLDALETIWVTFTNDAIALLDILVAEGWNRNIALDAVRGTYSEYATAKLLDAIALGCDVWEVAA